MPLNVLLSATILYFAALAFALSLFFKNPAFVVLSFVLLAVIAFRLLVLESDFRLRMQSRREEQQ